MHRGHEELRCRTLLPPGFLHARGGARRSASLYMGLRPPVASSAAEEAAAEAVMPQKHQ